MVRLSVRRVRVCALSGRPVSPRVLGFSFVSPVSPPVAGVSVGDVYSQTWPLVGGVNEPPLARGEFYASTSAIPDSRPMVAHPVRYNC